MQNKTLATLFMILSFISVTQANASEKHETKAKVSLISKVLAKDLIANHIGNIKLKDMNTNGLEPDNGQHFKISTQSTTNYIMSSTRNSPRDYPPTCAVLLFNQSKNFVSIVDTVGPNNDKRPWTCESTEAISFSDYYPDGCLKIIALYLATAPSSERSIVPVVLKLDFNKPSLVIDEALTSIFDDKDIKTIKAARSILNKQKGK